MPRCNCPVGPDPRAACAAPAVKFFVAEHPDTPDTFGSFHLYPRCGEHWRGTALPTSPLVTEVSGDEFEVWRVMLS